MLANATSMRQSGVYYGAFLVHFIFMGRRIFRSMWGWVGGGGGGVVYCWRADLMTFIAVFVTLLWAIIMRRGCDWVWIIAKDLYWFHTSECRIPLVAVRSGNARRHWHDAQIAPTYSKRIKSHNPPGKTDNVLPLILHKYCAYSSVSEFDYLLR